MNKFKVGDIIRGNDRNEYAYTSNHSLCKVTEVKDEDSIVVEVVAHKEPRKVGDFWNVESDKFELASRADCLEFNRTDLIPKKTIFIFKEI